MNRSFRVWLTLLLLIFLPTQFGKHFFFGFSYIDGIRVDYVSLTFYLTDAVSLLLIALHWKMLIEFVVRYKKHSLILMVLLFSNALVSQFPVLAFYHMLKIFQLLALFVIFSKTTLSKNQVLVGFLIGGLVELVLAVLQLSKKSAIQGPFYLLGERLMSLGTGGIAKASIGGTEFLRPYATFSHPNSMAGFYLLIFMFVLTSTKRKKDEKTKAFLYLLTLAVSVSLIFLSFSKATVAIFLVLSGIYLLKSQTKCTICTISKAVVPLILATYIFIAKTDPLSLEKRLYLIKSSIAIISENLLFGTGLGQYLFSQAKIANPYPYIFLQPVHNIFLLFFAQGGLFVTIFIFYFLWQVVKKQRNNSAFMYCVVVVITTGMIDHYWLTLQQNWLLLPIIFGALKKYS